jgi:hypothetical protein
MVSTELQRTNLEKLLQVGVGSFMQGCAAKNCRHCPNHGNSFACAAERIMTSHIFVELIASSCSRNEGCVYLIKYGKGNFISPRICNYKTNNPCVEINTCAHARMNENVSKYMVW